MNLADQSPAVAARGAAAQGPADLTRLPPALLRRHTHRLQFSRRESLWRRLLAVAGHAVLLVLTSSSALIVLFIFFYIARDAVPFFRDRGVVEFLFGKEWYPSADPPSFGARAIFFGSLLVTLGAALVAVPLGVLGAVCLSDILPFRLRQAVKPVVEVLAAIPSVAYGFFALVVFAPLLQEHGGTLLAAGWWLIGLPLALLAVVAGSNLAGNLLTRRPRPASAEADPQPAAGTGRDAGRMSLGLTVVFSAAALVILYLVGRHLAGLVITSGTNALNVSIILGIMALPTVMSVSEDALQAVGRELREGAYALGSTRAETLLRVVIPAAASGICAAVILGLMRAVGETMVVWMASGNAAQIPQPWYDVLEPIRTLTATIAGDMGEADHVTGSARYHVLFAMALVLLLISFVCNLVSERVIARSGRKHR